jgi:aminoglycoside phosphotransferase (APT) family kinase protein
MGGAGQIVKTQYGLGRFMDRYAPIPTPEQLERLGDDLGAPLTYDYRILGGLGGTMDVLRVEETGKRVVLKRYWIPDAEDNDEPAESEYRILTLARKHGVPAPSPLWVDRIGLFPERAVVMTFVEGDVVLDPLDPLHWAAQMAKTLHRVHGIRIGPTDDDLFPTIGWDDSHSSEEAVREHPLGPELWEARLAALGAVVPEDLVYVHHDFWPGNTLWINERLVAVVDWEGGCIADPALDVAYCALDLRLLGLEEAADHFVKTYREVSGRTLGNLPYWDLLALSRPMPDISMWVPGWQAMGIEMTPEAARLRHVELIQAALHGSSS